MRKATSHKVLEVACFDPESCFIAEQAGADRIEFCRDYGSGGLTPLRDDILKVRERISIPLHVIIRPRAGDFLYSAEEMETMKRDILFCKAQRVDGLVFGVLTVNDEIDVSANQALVELCAGLPCTFHRAVDACPDPEKAFGDIIHSGFRRVLTSGGQASAPEGIEQLKSLQKTFGGEIIIMPGGGIRSHNIGLIARETQCPEFHSAALVAGKSAVDAHEVSLIKEHISHD